MSAAISFDHVGMRYTAGYSGGLKDRLFDWILRKDRRVLRRPALEDLSFTIKQGESVAILGRNGSGKSTTLGLMARVLSPTTGRVEVNGTVAPLLELGAGFHPDLDGLENARMNAVLLGLSRRQADAAVGQILAFADIGDAVFEPLRTYSTGMLARLGFAVAVSVPCDIMLIDEVLAVGDTAFQAKCLEAIQERKRQGVTVVYVGHGAEMVRSVCERGVVLQAGTLHCTGNIDACIAAYHQLLAPPASAG